MDIITFQLELPDIFASKDYRETALCFDEIFSDSTCVKANIHFPVDWILLRDAAQTLIGSIIQIRKHGLYHRIDPPEQFIRQMNKLCIEMTHARKKKDLKKKYKIIFRRMKRLMKTIEGHDSLVNDNYTYRLTTTIPAVSSGHIL